MKKIFLISGAILMTALILQDGAFCQSALENLTIIKKDVRSKRISSYDRSGGNNDRFENIEPGETRTLAEIEGAGMINHIWITISPEAPALNRSDIILRIYWDGNDYPSVESPIGPFFGQGWDETYPWASLPLSASPVKGNALVSYFKMPFVRGAKIEIENQADVKINAFYFYIDYLQMEKVPDEVAYFHAWYNQEVTEGDPEGENEWNTLGQGPSHNPGGEKNYKILETSGKGHFVGVNYFVNSPTPMWYGEGDDMFFIDGESKASLHGTGTEDYFNSSWCPNEKYFHPYYGYARVPDHIGWLGRTHCYRFHIEDPIYFDESLLFSIEHGHANNLTLELATVAYWYLEQPVRLDPIPEKEQRKFMPVIRFQDIHRWRHEWRKNIGPESNPWGNERVKD